mgnify:CR=1 FL=1
MAHELGEIALLWRPRLAVLWTSLLAILAAEPFEWHAGLGICGVAELQWCEMLRMPALLELRRQVIKGTDMVVR